MIPLILVISKDSYTLVTLMGDPSEARFFGNELKATKRGKFATQLASQLGFVIACTQNLAFQKKKKKERKREMSKVKEVTVFNRLYIFLAFPLVRISIPSNDVRCFFSLLREIFSGFSDSKANLQKVS